ncbi:Ctr copper transporter [Apiospora arundinis]
MYYNTSGQKTLIDLPACVGWVFNLDMSGLEAVGEPHKLMRLIAVAPHPGLIVQRTVTFYQKDARDPGRHLLGELWLGKGRREPPVLNNSLATLIVVFVAPVAFAVEPLVVLCPVNHPVATIRVYKHVAPRIQVERAQGHRQICGTLADFLERHNGHPNESRDDA